MSAEFRSASDASRHETGVPMAIRLKEVYIAVMSYNMGPLLRNCVSSLERHAASFDVGIYDDNSSDTSTQEILNYVASRHRVVISNGQEAQADSKTGGLWTNMNRAVADALSGAYKYILFIQDDMQLVRPIDDACLQEYGAIFANIPSVAQIRVHFMKHPFVHPGHVPSQWIPSAVAPCYVSKRYEFGLLATGIVRLDYLKATGFKFNSGELNNAQAAASLGWISVFPINPIAMFLPWPPTITDRLPVARRTVQLVTDYLFRVGFHPFRDMAPAEVYELMNRPKEELPYAERYLALAGKESHIRPWWYERSYKFLIKAFRQRGKGMGMGAL